MTALSKQQLEWIYGKCLTFAVTWSEHPPKSDSEWSEFIQEAKELYEKSRGNNLMQGLLIQTINYIDSVSDGNRPVLDMIQ